MKFYDSVHYHGLANSMPDDNRQGEWEKQFKEFGYDNTYFWNLDITLVKIVQPLIKAFGDNKNNIFQMEDEYNNVLQKFTKLENNPDEGINTSEVGDAFKALSLIIDRMWN